MMNALQIIKSRNCSIQDSGRYGYEKYGICNSGAMDQYAFKMSNALLANNLNEATIEVNFSSLELISNTDISICVTGALCDIRIEGEEKEQWSVFTLEAGKNLVVENIQKGTKAYVGFAGGIDVASIHGSCSYDSTLGIGEKLYDNKEIKLKEKQKSKLIRAKEMLPKEMIPKYSSPWNIDFCLGPDETIFKNHIKFFEDVQFVVSLKSNNVGIRLNKFKLINYSPKQTISRGIIPGAIEITPEGQPIVLHRGRGGTIGYPVIGCVSSADLDMIGQVAPNDIVKFKNISIDDAIEKYKQKEVNIKNIWEKSYISNN